MGDAEHGVTIVTGASEGIGRVIASHLAQGGYRVAATARSLDKLEVLAEETVSSP
jgi:short-subunit dehydrogenase